jgi:hypothetical protein
MMNTKEAPQKYEDFQ